jgi:MGT family glycosyltransferase
MENALALHREEVADTVSQLSDQYARDRPDLIVYDDVNVAAKLLANNWKVRTVQHTPMMVNARCQDNYDANLVLVSVPRFLQAEADALATHFHFVGFMPEGRREFFRPWTKRRGETKLILVSVTTGLLPPIEFLRTAIHAFADQSLRVVLSLGPQIDPTLLGAIPAQFELNEGSSNFEILEQALLFVGQGGQGSTLEALYHGVPPLLVPPTPVHDSVARRVQELGIGSRLEQSRASAEHLREAADFLLMDGNTRARVRETQRQMRSASGSILAADLIADQLS